MSHSLLLVFEGLRGEAVLHAARADQIRLEEFAFTAVHPEVVHHADPEQRKGRDVLRQLRRVTTLRQAFGGARFVHQLDGVFHQPRVPRDVQRHERLNARVADVL